MAIQYVNILRNVTQPLGVEFGAPHGGMKLVNNGSCNGLVPDGNSPLFDSTLIQCVLIIIIIDYSFIFHLLVSFAILYWSNVYVLVPSLIIY